MTEAEDSDKLALVSVEGNEVALPNNEVALPNNEIVAADFLPVLETQENKGTFEQVSDDGQSKQTVHQQQKMILRGMESNGQSVHLMEGAGQKAIMQENAEGKRMEFSQEKTLKGVAITPTSQTQRELTETRTATAMVRNDGTQARELEEKRQQTFMQENEEGKRMEFTQERALKGVTTTPASYTEHELTEKITAAAIDMKDGTQTREIEKKRLEMLLHTTEQEKHLKAAVQTDKAAVKTDDQGLHQGVREQNELELHAQVSFDGSKQLSGKFRNVKLLSNETAAGTRIQFQQTKAFLGMDDDGELAIENQQSLVVEFTLQNYLRDPKQFVQNEDVKNSFRGFIDVLAKQKKLPWGLGARILYKSGLVIFFFINFLYPIIVFAIEQKHAAYNIVCGLISFIGLVYELFQTLPDLYRYIKKLRQKWRKRKEDELVIATLDQAANEDTSPTEEEVTKPAAEPEAKPAADSSEADVDALDYSKKVWKVLKDLIIDSLGEFLIYPSIICSLYGFVNERGWEFNGAIAVFDFLLLLYGIMMDVFYAKVIHVWLVLKVIRNSYNVHDKYENISSLGWKKVIERIVTPFSMTVPYAFTVAVMHWFMLALIAVRIYADNFSKDRSDRSQQPVSTQRLPQEMPDSTEPTGNYVSAPYTRYMIFCGAYLPVASMVVYIILNKYWFLQIYWLIKNKGFLSVDNDKDMTKLVKYQYIKRMPESVKTMAFLRDPFAYLAVIFLMVPFIPFVVGAFLPDYSNSDLPDGARGAADGLGAFFIITFLMANCQAALIFAILIIIITVTTLYLLYAFTHPKEMAKKAYRDYRNSR